MARASRTSRRCRCRCRAAASAALAFTLIGLVCGAARAKNPEQPETAPRPGSEMTFIDHDGPQRYWIGAEANSIFQYHPPFHSARPLGPMSNSLRPGAESALSALFTVFAAYAPTRTTELILDPEMALGGGLSNALGAAGFPNLDVVRNPTLSHAPYIARAEIHQIIPLSDEWVPNEDRGPISSLAMVPKHRLELRLGKMSTADLFDVNPVGSDSHLQFMNWTVDNNGSYDYAADTRGYTYALVVEYQGPRLEARLGEMLMPTQANGINLDTDIARDRGENLELEIEDGRSANSGGDFAGTTRLLGYLNHANMGSYTEAIAAARAAPVPTVPDVMATRQKGRTKGGFGINVVQNLGPLFRAFARAGWSSGKYESYAYTEVEDTVAAGGDVRGAPWRRPSDRVGLAIVSNGISADHRAYLRAGGLGFLLGDGYLRYGRELIVEHYYNLHIWRGAFLAEDVQLIANPGYNADRGPVWVFSLRAHLEL